MTSNRDEHEGPRRPPPAGRDPDEADVRWFYRFALHREAESDQTVAELAGWTMEGLVRGFFDSQEFTSKVLEPLMLGRAPAVDAGPPPADELVDWAAATLPLSAEGVLALEDRPSSWSALYLALISDPVFRSVLGPDHPLTAPAAASRLARAAVVRGALEDAHDGVATGWIVTTDDSGPPRAELWCDGVFLGAATPDRFRREAVERFGGDGIAGFEIEHATPDLVRRRMRLELRDRSGLILDVRVFERSEPSIDDLAATRRELSEIRDLLQRIEHRLPGLDTGLSQPLSEYGDYFERWYRRDAVPASVAAVARVGVVIDGADASLAAIQDAVWSVVEQTASPHRTVLLVGPDLAVAAADLVTRVQWRGGPDITCRTSTGSDRAGDVSRAIDEIGEVDAVLLMDAAGVVSSELVDRIAHRFRAESNLAALYFDEDQFDGRDGDKDFRVRRHALPAFKPGFDPELLLQTPYCGPVVAFRPEVLRSTGLRGQAGPLYAADALLRLPATARVGHEARVLVTRHPGVADTQAWLGCVSEAMQDHADVSVELHPDAAVPSLGGAIRLRRPPAPGTTVTVIVPTRDRIELLRPCVESVLSHRGSNVVALDLLIIDHESEEPETQTYLRDLERDGKARILPFEGPFNWALMNNLAAARSEAQVLVFLNNDTIVLTPDWLDELVGQAMRAEVGPVGCRLLYSDGTIQHAGFVVQDRSWSFLTHEGVGRPGSDIGYLGRHALVHATAAVTGACMAIRAETFRALGGFDAALYPVEANDVDLCFRAREAGLTVLYDPHATLYHLESKTRGLNLDPERSAAAEATARVMWARWGETVAGDPAFNPHFDRASKPFARLRPPPGTAVDRG